MNHLITLRLSVITRQQHEALCLLYTMKYVTVKITITLFAGGYILKLG